MQSENDFSMLVEEVFLVNSNIDAPLWGGDLCGNFCAKFLMIIVQNVANDDVIFFGWVDSNVMLFYYSRFVLARLAQVMVMYCGFLTLIHMCLFKICSFTFVSYMNVCVRWNERLFNIVVLYETFVF